MSLEESLQRVFVNEVNWSTYGVKRGVPQSHILVPLLFIIYVNSLIYQIKGNSTSVQCSDDYLLLLTKKSSGTANFHRKQNLVFSDVFFKSDEIISIANKTDYISWRFSASAPLPTVRSAPPITEHGSFHSKSLF